MSPIEPRADETLDLISEARLKVLQKKKGQRITLDALQLAKFSLQTNPGGKALDLGAGTGVISLILAAEHKIESVVALELQPEFVELAQRNARLNGFESKINIRRGDWRQIRQVLKGEKFDLVAANPPYWKAGSGRLNPGQDHALARHELNGDLEDLIRACRYLVQPCKGSVNLIYPAQRLTETLILMEKHQLQPKQMQFIHHNPDSQASLFMVRAVLDGQRGVQILPPLTVRIRKEDKCV